MASHATVLLGQLRDDPYYFAERLGNELLSSIKHRSEFLLLRQLIQDGSDDVRRVALWILSELGSRGSSITDCVIPFLSHGDRRIRLHCIESLATSEYSVENGFYGYILLAVADPDPVVSSSAMFILTEAREDQIRSALEMIDKQGYQTRSIAFSRLLTGSLHGLHRHELAKNHISTPLDRYSAIADQRLFGYHEPRTAIDDPAIKMYLERRKIQANYRVEQRKGKAADGKEGHGK